MPPFIPPHPPIPNLHSITIANPTSGTLAGPLTSIDGTAPPASVVFVSIDGGDDVQATAGADGHWSLGVPQPSTGNHTVRAQNAADSVTVAFTVPRPFKSTAHLPAGYEQPRQPGQAPPAPAPAPALTITTPVDGSTVASVPRISGTAPPGAVVNVVVDGDTLVSATANADGVWSISSAAGLSASNHYITARTGSSVATINVTVRPDAASDGNHDWLWLVAAVGAVAWWGWRFLSKKAATAQVEAPRHNPSEHSDSMKLQTIIVSKDRAASKSEARDIAASFSRNAPLPAADETGRSYRFRQRDPRDFVAGSFRTIQPTPGVSLVLGHLR